MMIEAPWVGGYYEAYRNNYYGFNGRDYDGIVVVEPDEDEEDEDEF